MRVMLKRLSLEDEDIEFSQAVLVVRNHGVVSSWCGFVRDADGAGLLGVAQLALDAETEDGRQLAGKAEVSALDRIAGTFELEGIGPLLVDGHELQA